MGTCKQFRAIVRGHVQGVYFRATTVEEAQRLRLSGFAKNLRDGSVEVVARGEESDLKRLIEFLHRGPAPARVDSVSVDWSDTSSAPDPFTVRY